MRKITQDAIRAFYTHKYFKSGNTEVTSTGNCGKDSITCLKLHGTTIARLEQNQLSINPHGYTTATTKERLNGLSGVSINQKDFIWYLNGKELDCHSWTIIE